MRRWTSWARELKVEPEHSAHQWDALAFAQVELGLALWLELGIDEPAEGLWALLSRNSYARLLTVPLSPQSLNRIAVARHYLWPMRRRQVWRQALRRYWHEPVFNRGFEQDPDTGLPRRRTPGVDADRHALYAQTLERAPEFRPVRYRPAPPGDYRWSSGGRQIPLRVPKDLPAPDAGIIHSLQGRPAADPVEVGWGALRRTARAMQAKRGKLGHKGERWTRRFKNLTLDLKRADGSGFTAGDDVDDRLLTVAGMMHLVGMVGAGKSTLRDILAVHLAWQGENSLIVVGDVTEQTELVRFYNSLGASAAAVRGDGDRETHLLRLHRRQASEHSSMLDHDHPGFADLSTACGMEALRQDDDPTPLPYRDAGCYRGFHPVPPASDATESDELEDNAEPFDCPQWWNCQRHHAARTLATARIWVATPASLLYCPVPSAMNGLSLRYLELAVTRSLLMIVDEADRVQSYFDDEFFPAGVLSGQGLKSWVDRISNKLGSRLADDGRFPLRNPDTQVFTQSLRQMPAIVDLIYVMLREEDHLVGHVDPNYFNNWLLLNDLVTTWEDNGSIPGDAGAFRSRIHAWLDAPLGVAAEDRDTDADDSVPADDEGRQLAQDLTALVHAAVNLSPEEAGSQLAAWHHCHLHGTRNWDEEALGASVARLAFALLVSVLQHHLARVTTLWPRVQRQLGLSPADNVFGHRPPEDYLPLVPDAPMGNVIGFQYLHDRGPHPHQASAELRFFRAVGTGRLLLSSLAELADADGKPSPNVMLLSGTSWAGTSHRYHVAVPVCGILRAPDDMVRNTQFFLTPLKDPVTQATIKMSGQMPGPERDRALMAMMRALATPSTSGISLLEHERDHGITDDARRNIMLLVGSYTDSALGAATLVQTRPEWRGKVCYLVPDDAPIESGALGPDGTIALRRGDVASFTATGAWILLAPLLAVERGHNILNEVGAAAFGSMYVIPRPHPRPDDIHLAVQAVNAYDDTLLDDPDFQYVLASRERTLDEAAVLAREWKRIEWHRLLHRYLAYSRLGHDDRIALAWDTIVSLNQVIGRLVRGNVPARVHFCDQAFAPGTITGNAVDTARDSILIGMRDALAPYFTPSRGAIAPSADERAIADALYGPFWNALHTLLAQYGL
ncbi:pPIWI_RE_Z domain-containing protein [Streptomyces sp. NPDC002521]